MSVQVNSAMQLQEYRVLRECRHPQRQIRSICDKSFNKDPIIFSRDTSYCQKMPHITMLKDPWKNSWFWMQMISKI